MDELQLAELRTKAFNLVERLGAPDKELKAFLLELFHELSKQHKQQVRTNDLIEEVLKNISLSQIANEG